MSDMSWLPPLVSSPVDAPRGPVADVTNPGTSSPARQQYASPTVDQTRSVTTSSASHINSNGQAQFLDHNRGSQGVTVTPSSAPLRNASGDAHRAWAAKRPKDNGVIVQKGLPGLPATINAGEQNHSKQIQEFAVRMPVAKTFDGGAKRPGRLPKNVNIR